MKKVLLLPLALLTIAAASPAGAAALRTTPGATLIIPYFEVDLDAPDGRSTLVSVSNAAEPVIAHATIWTDWGIPVYSWDLYLGKDALVTYNLRDLLVAGTLPATGGPAAFPGCSNPVATPPPADLPYLQRMLSGRPTGEGSTFCGSEPRADTSLATGSITIDTVRRCSNGQAVYPTSDGYFSDFPEPLASGHAGLWGDFTLVDPAENYAEGFEAIALGIAPDFSESFADLGGDRGIAREPLGKTCSRMRFLEGGPFAARTALFVYTAPPLSAEGRPCDQTLGGSIWDFGIYDEDGHPLSGEAGLSFYRHRRYSGRVDVGTDLGIGAGGGYVEIHTARHPGFNTPTVPNTPTQHLILGAIQASGRFAVGTLGTPLSACE